jgi:hypothetical protein
MLDTSTTPTATTTAVVQQAQSLPALIDRAATALASAKTAAEVLEARELASFTYDMAKRQARIARAKAAHDTVVAAAHRAQADALTIKAQAECRLADEYDAAQERGEVAGHGGNRGNQFAKVPAGNDATAADLGLSRKDIHEARQIRDAEEAQPGIVRRTLDAMLTAGREPTRAAVKTAVAPKTRRKSADLAAAAGHVMADPDAHRAILRELLDIDSHYKLADLLISVFSHRPFFAQDVANAMLDRVLWARAKEENEVGREAVR